MLTKSTSITLAGMVLLASLTGASQDPLSDRGADLPPSESRDLTAPQYSKVTEVVDKSDVENLDEQMTTQEKIDALYEEGYKPDWRGAIDFEAPIVEDTGDEIWGVVDLDAAISIEEAYIVDLVEKDEYQKAFDDNAVVDQQRAEQEPQSLGPLMNTASLISCGNANTLYRLVNTFEARSRYCFTNGGGWASTNGTIGYYNIDRVCLRNATGFRHTGAQLNYRYGNNQYATSPWRSTSSRSYSCYDFNGNVSPQRAYVNVRL